jgi:hypothetical protein
VRAGRFNFFKLCWAMPGNARLCQEMLGNARKGGCMGRLDVVKEYRAKLGRARSESSKRKYTSMINNLVGYEVLETGKSGSWVRKEWGLSDDYK